MERKTLLIVRYSQVGHHEYPEDTWELEANIENADDLFHFAQEMFMESARGFRDYPLNGLFSFKALSFFQQDIIIIDEKIYRSDKETSSQPEYYDDVYKQFKTWEKSYKITCAEQDKKDQEEKIRQLELAQLKQLKEKYEQ